MLTPMVATERSGGPRRSSPWAAPAVVGAVLVGLIGVAASAVGGRWTFTPRLPAWDPAPVDLTPLDRAPVNHLPQWPWLPREGDVTIGDFLVWGVLVVFGVAVAYVLWRIIPRRRIRIVEDGAPPAGEVRPDLTRLQAGALDALDLLDRIADPKDAVVRSWLALELAAERSGAPRDPAATPTEFTAAVLLSTNADPTAVRRLLGLYHRARFSSHPIGMEEVKGARACVLELSRTWRSYDDALRASVPGSTR